MNLRPIDYSNKDYEGFRSAMLDLLQYKIPEYTDLSSSDAGVVIIELLAHGLDINSYYNDKLANEVYLDTAQERENIILLAKMLGYTLYDGRPSRFKQVFSITPQDTPFVIPRGFKIKTTENSVEPSVLFETESDLVIPPNCTGEEQGVLNEYLYSVPVVQGETITDEIVGTSTNAPNQKFYLNYSPVIKDSVSLIITENGTTEEWTRVDNFLNSSPLDKHYVVSIDGTSRGIIIFGNGNTGKIPEPFEDGIVATYRVGGGELGNVSPYSINVFEQRLAGLQETFNPTVAYEMGVDRETDLQVKHKAPSQFKTTWGAITLTDFEDIALKQPEIVDARCERFGALNVKLYVLPKDYGTLDLHSAYATDLLANLYNIIGKRKLICTDVFIELATKIPVNVNIELTLYPNSLRSDVDFLVQSAMQDVFNSNNLRLGETIHPSMIMREVLGIDGVKYAECSIEGMPNELAISEVLYLENLNLVMNGGI